MEKFVARYNPLVTGVLSGFDRLVFRGSLLPLIRDGGMSTFLKFAGVRLLDFKRFVVTTSERVKTASVAEARHRGRPIQHLLSAGTSKENTARRLPAAHPVDPGLICILTTVAPCLSFA